MRTNDRTHLAEHILIGVATLAVAAASVAAPAAVAQGAPDARPNVVVIMADDMRADELHAMPNVQSLLVARGTSFSRHYANHPLCCPSRVTLMTGQYAHNHGVFGNSRQDTKQFMDGGPSDILPEWLHSAGYRTALVGKYLNEYGHDPHDRSSVPRGFDEWHALIDPPKGHPTVYDYRLNDNGTTRSHGSKPTDHLTGVLTDRAVRFVRRSVRGKPFFLWASYFAPHSSGPKRDPHNRPADYCARAPKPAPGALGPFRDGALPARANFDVAPLNKPAAVRKMAPAALTPEQKDEFRRTHNCRLASLQAVDRGVKQIVEALGPELANTLIVFVSDNGFMLGEHRIVKGKSFLYEESSNVPLVLSGPGVPVRGAAPDLAVNADIAPTILAATANRDGTPIGHARAFDGVPLSDLLAGRVQRRGIVLETQQFAGIHAGRWKWARYPAAGGPKADLELYDLDNDPFELNNLYDVSKQPNPPRKGYGPTAKTLRALAAQLTTCEGEGCR